ncbi:MAG: hypothetical protein V1847_00235 [Candidatus Diapherotrites archaeon]
MGSNKEAEFKQFLNAARKKVGNSISAAPFWVARKANKRIWNKKQKRNWRETDLGTLYKKHKAKQVKRVKGRRHFKRGKKVRDR